MKSRKILKSLLTLVKKISIIPLFAGRVGKSRKNGKKRSSVEQSFPIALIVVVM